MASDWMAEAARHDSEHLFETHLAAERSGWELRAQGEDEMGCHFVEANLFSIIGGAAFGHNRVEEDEVIIGEPMSGDDPVQSIAHERMMPVVHCAQYLGSGQPKASN